MTPEVSRWVANWPVPLTVEMAISRIKSSRELASAGDALPFGVVEKASTKVIGWVTRHRDPMERRRGAFGYWLGEEYHGKGDMRELCAGGAGRRI